jgi:hypothetical protein
MPGIDLTSATPAAQLKFNVAHARYNSSTTDELQVQASTDCGITWTVIYDKTSPTLATTANSTFYFTPAAGQWRTDSISLAGFAGQSEVLFSFTTISGYGNNVYIDDVSITDVTIGIAQATADPSFSVYPNPVSGILTVSFPEKSTSKTLVTLFSQDGQMVKSISLAPSENLLHLDVSGLAKGLYALRVTDGNKVEVKSIVVQ